MKKIALLLSMVLIGSLAHAVVVFEDDFESYTGSINGANWNPKWDGNTNLVHLQQSLMMATNGVLTLDTTKAYRNYLCPSKAGFTVSTNADIYIVTDIQYEYEGGGDITNNFNKPAFGLFFSTTDAWWSGVNKGHSMANRGSAIGNNLGQNPWIEGWQTHSSLGVNTANADTSIWFKVANKLVASNETVWIQALYYDIDDKYLDSPIHEGALQDSGISNSVTIYAGYNTGWNDVGNTNISSFSKFTKIHYDNFYVGTKPQATEEIFYEWVYDSFWTPHSTWNHTSGDYTMDYLNNGQYWWVTTNASYADPLDQFAQHRPGLMNLPPGGGDDPPWGTNDVAVGGLGWRGQYVTNAIREIVTNETLKLSFEYRLFVNTNENARIMDTCFTTTGDSTTKYMGGTGSELGFVLSQKFDDDSIKIHFDPAALNGTADLSVALTNLGIDIASADLAGDELFVVYTAKKTTTADTWSVGLSISNTVTMQSYEVASRAIMNSTAYAASELYLNFYTFADLSKGTGDGSNTGGYEIDEVLGKIVYPAESLLSGFALWADDLGLTGVKTDDFDSDGLLDYGEYVFGGNPANPADQGTQPHIDMSSGYYNYSLLGDDTVVAYVLTNVNLLHGSWGTSDTINVTATDQVLSAYSNAVDTTTDQLYIMLELE